jgi:O-methyltransferase
MNRFLIKLSIFFKGLVIGMRPHVLFGWLIRPLLMASNTLSMTRWIAQQDKRNIPNDFYTLKRDYAKRHQLYQHVLDSQQLKEEVVDYLEFGVYKGGSFKWWLANCQHADARFYGFDTFEGLPEDWGTYSKGDMSANIPVINDSRGEFFRGLFQDTLPGFLAAQRIRRETRKIIHLDADLFSSTLFTLTSLAPHLKKGDILLFDEFNVPNHEYFAFRIFCDSFYVKTRMLGAVNNYYQVAMIIE